MSVDELTRFCGNDVEQVLVAPGRRSPRAIDTVAADAGRDGALRVGGEHLLDGDAVLPVVAEVVV